MKPINPELAALEILELHKEASEGPWLPALFPPDSDPISYFADLLSKGEGPIWGVVIPVDENTSVNDEALFVAITGNGPTSEANMETVIRYRELAPYVASCFLNLIAERDRLREEKDEEIRFRKEIAFYLKKSLEDCCQLRSERRKLARELEELLKELKNEDY